MSVELLGEVLTSVVLAVREVVSSDTRADVSIDVLIVRQLEPWHSSMETCVVGAISSSSMVNCHWSPSPYAHEAVEVHVNWDPVL